MWYSDGIKGGYQESSCCIDRGRTTFRSECLWKWSFAPFKHSSIFNGTECWGLPWHWVSKLFHHSKTSTRVQTLWLESKFCQLDSVRNYSDFSPALFLFSTVRLAEVAFLGQWCTGVPTGALTKMLFRRYQRRFAIRSRWRRTVSFVWLSTLSIFMQSFPRTFDALTSLLTL